MQMPGDQTWLKNLEALGSDVVLKLSNTRAKDFNVNLERAKKAEQSKNYDLARQSYIATLESIRQYNVMNQNKFEDLYQKTFQMVKSFFTERDPGYAEFMNIAKGIVQNSPGIMQTDLYPLIQKFPKEICSTFLFYAAEAGHIKRTKKGRSYQLNLP